MNENKYMNIDNIWKYVKCFKLYIGNVLNFQYPCNIFNGCILWGGKKNVDTRYFNKNARKQRIFKGRNLITTLKYSLNSELWQYI